MKADRIKRIIKRAIPILLLLLLILYRIPVHFKGETVAVDQYNDNKEYPFTYDIVVKRYLFKPTMSVEYIVAEPM